MSNNKYSPKEFTDLVIRDCKRQISEDEASYLRSDENLLAWHAKLVDLCHELEEQYTSRKADLLSLQQECLGKVDGKSEYFQAKAEYESWKGAAMGYRRGLERRLSEAKRRLKEFNTSFQAVPEASRKEIYDQVYQRLTELTRLVDESVSNKLMSIDNKLDYIDKRLQILLSSVEHK